jgi:PAS domain S-box-containing protein
MDCAVINRSDEQLLLILDALPIAVSLSDSRGAIRFINNQFTAQFGYDTSDVSTISEWLDLAYPDKTYREKTNVEFTARFLADPVPIGVSPLPARISCKDGSIRMVEISGRMLGEDSLRIYQDVTERNLISGEMEETEARYRWISENTGDVVWLLDLESGRFKFVSPSVTRVRGFTQEEVMRQNLRESFTPESYQFITEFMPKRISAFLAGDESMRVMLHEVSQPRKNGSIVPTEVVSTLITNSSGRPVEILGVTRDITERKQAEEARAKLEAQLRQSQKMEAIGQLAGGVAHDFNNILTVIMCNASLLADEPELSAESRELIKQLAEASGRASNLTRQLLTFSRRQVIRLRHVNLNEVVRNMDSLLSRLLGENITLQCLCNEDLPCINADPGMLEQVILNLAVNARDAMPKGGRLVIRTQPEEIIESQADHHSDARPGHFVVLSVTDTGVGMDKDTLTRIFEPFFTTKESGKGTGLGLATVYGIVKQHRGWAVVKSTVGEGTTFKIFLPSITAAARATKAAPGKNSTQRIGGTETILVVEDEPAVRQLAVRFLDRLGYQVHQAADGLEALDVWEEHRGKIDLLLTDIMMPNGLTGVDLANQLKLQRPGLKIVYCSGYSRDVIGPYHNLLPTERYLAKPFNPNHLAQMIRSCLDT